MFKQKLMRGVIAFQLVSALTFSLIAPAIPVARADGNGSPDACLDTTANVVGSITGTDDLVEYDAGSGKIIEAVCIKSGENMFGGEQHSDLLDNGSFENECYTVAGVGTQKVTVERIDSGRFCQEISHIDVVLGQSNVNYCDLTQKPAGQSIAQWLAANQINGADCFAYSVENQCGDFNAIFTKNETGLDYEFRYVIGEQTPAIANWEGDGTLPVQFTEDEHGGSVKVTYYVVGPEKDYLTGSTIPNIWDDNGVTVTVDTDCEELQAGSLSGYKWNDVDGNGNLDNGQKLTGWTIFLDENDNQILDNNELSDITDANGNYEFTGLALGEYTICEVMQSGWTQTHPGTQSGCTSTTLTENDPDKSGINYSFGNQEVVVVDYCDPTQRPRGQSIAQWLAANQIDGSDCFGYTPSNVCGEFNAILNKNETPYNYEFRFVLGDQTPTLANWAGNGVLPASFLEDSYGGSVEITYYVVGEEKDYFVGFGMPNIWDGNGVTVTVDTDCLPNEEPKGDLDIIKMFCADVPVYNPIYDLRVFKDTAVFGCDSEGVQTTDVLFNIYTEDNTSGTPIATAEIKASALIDGVGVTTVEDLDFGFYTVCEVELDNYETWVHQNNFYARVAMIEEDYFTQDNCVMVYVGEGGEAEFVNVPVPTPTPDVTPTPTPTPTPGQVLGEQIERPQFLAAVTQLPSTGVDSEGLSLIMALFFGAVFTRRRIS